MVAGYHGSMDSRAVGRDELGGTRERDANASS